jgi:hypothetical protein
VQCKHRTDKPVMSFRLPIIFRSGNEVLASTQTEPSEIVLEAVVTHFIYPESSYETVMAYPMCLSLTRTTVQSGKRPRETSAYESGE